MGSIILYWIVALVSHCLVVLGLWILGLISFEFPEGLGSRVLGFLGVWLFGPMTLKLGSAASRSVNNPPTCVAGNGMWEELRH